MAAAKKVSIVVSFRNEEASLPLLVDEASRVLDAEPEDYEFVFVNDDSNDGSVAALEKLGAQGAPIRLVNMTRRFGVEECFLAGIEKSEGDAIILMYADLQDPVETLPEMLAHWREGSDVVHAIRRRRIDESASKIVAAHIGYRLINYFSDIDIPVDAGDFKLISRRVATHLLSMHETDPYLRGLIPWIGFRQSKVEYDLQPRRIGNSKVPLFGYKALTVLLTGLMSFSLYPIFLVLMAGAFGLALSALLALVLLLLRPAGALTLGLAVYATALWSGLMLALGTVGLYAGRAYKDVRGRPRYLVKDVRDLEQRASG